MIETFLEQLNKKIYSWNVIRSPKNANGNEPHEYTTVTSKSDLEALEFNSGSFHFTLQKSKNDNHIFELINERVFLKKKTL